MKKYARVLLAAMVITPLLVTGVAAADTTATTPSTSTTTTTTLTDQQKADLQKRLADRKASLKTTLTAVEQLKIKTKCTTSQGVVSTLGTRIKTVETNRDGVYAAISTDLNALSTKLKAKGIDTTTLNTEIAALKTKTDTFKADLTSYQQALADLKDMDCVSDPTAFKASLDSARTLRDKVAADATDIRTYATGTIQPTLKSLRTQVAAQRSSASSGGQQ